MSESAVHIIAHGRVQGVGFRFFVRDKANLFGLKGWVRNCSDGTVEIHAEGSKEILRDFVTEVEKGPIFGNVSDLTVDWIEPENAFTGFNIKF
ncbi:acylphosphatase [Candidatus Latescibacterota bacterium]